MEQKALFLDLNGTLITTKSGEETPKNIDDWEFIPSMLTRIKAYKEAGYHIIIVSNEAGIELGHTTNDKVTEKLDRISKAIEEHIGQGVNYMYCGNTESYMRKPNPGMAYQMAIELKLRLRTSVMVGNSNSDEKFAKEAYIGTYIDIKHFLKEDGIIR